MFIRLQLHQKVTVKPSDLGPAVTRKIEQLLRDLVEGHRLPNIGLVTCVLDILDDQIAREGHILDTGDVVFHVRYSAIVYRAIPRSVVDGSVVDVQPDHLLVNVGGTNVYVSRGQMPPSFEYCSDGGLVRFATPEGAAISNGTLLRVRIIGETPNREGFGATGTINEQYLGLK